MRSTGRSVRCVAFRDCHSVGETESSPFLRQSFTPSQQQKAIAGQGLHSRATITPSHRRHSLVIRPTTSHYLNSATTIIITCTSESRDRERHCKHREGKAHYVVAREQHLSRSRRQSRSAWRRCRILRTRVRRDGECRNVDPSVNGRGGEQMGRCHDGNRRDGQRPFSSAK